MDDFEDKKRFEEAIEAGQRNLRAVHLLSNWCSHSCSELSVSVYSLQLILIPLVSVLLTTVYIISNKFHLSRAAFILLHAYFRTAHLRLPQPCPPVVPDTSHPHLLTPVYVAHCSLSNWL